MRKVNPEENRPIKEKYRYYDATSGTILRISKSFTEASKILIFIFLFCQIA
jgi:hypothetical protein